ncbi:MFS transporter [Cupriavidus sp. TA19]|uniref:Bug family tripartite tricarboxylate transporter substrate binding protein n=1 Tax=unclassified Cupriavidus TaxID=2640874 RepID=UPI000E2E5872|nr:MULTISPECIES: tripartite tricarboxylate transporter substrate binding protein [unclassified Cupriavidus]BDB28322.1 tripartite tricarboxylate transporter substrate binding protein [Cupriavidus sp. P-10]GLC91161.1 MFS transporter [Cupriavidus sp. TA19]
MKTLANALVATCVTLATSLALAGPYPDKPIRMVVPFPPGGTTDLLGRVLATRLSETLGQQVVVDNRPGAGGTIGSDVVAKAPADGYTLLFGTVGTQSINASLYKKLPFDTQKDFTPVALFAGVPNILVVNPNVPAKTVQELMSYARSHPGALNMGSAGNGTTNHLSGELFKSMAKVKIVHVPYKGSGPAMADLLANQVQLMFDNLPGSLPHVKAGRLRALAVTSATRSPALPDVPTMAEAGVTGYEADVWFGVVGPRNLPPEVVTRLSQEITRIAQDKSMRDKLVQAGASPLTSTQDQFSLRIRKDMEKWARLVKESGASID